ncbi:AHH domain-containing protein [Xanthomonas hortorum pv. vitians]|nr:AHH domain-containing protein [Xanthomonas hortorum pv. vitians]
MPRSRPVFQDHHAIEQQTLDRSPLLKALSNAWHFDIHAPENRLFLPSDPAFAQTLGITPHRGGPISDYQVELRQRLWRLEQTPDGVGALAGDADALERIAGRVETLRDTVRVGLIRGGQKSNWTRHFNSFLSLIGCWEVSFPQHAEAKSGWTRCSTWNRQRRTSQRQTLSSCLCLTWRAITQFVACSSPTSASFFLLPG